MFGGVSLYFGAIGGTLGVWCFSAFRGFSLNGAQGSLPFCLRAPYVSSIRLIWLRGVVEGLHESLIGALIGIQDFQVEGFRAEGMRL